MDSNFFCDRYACTLSKSSCCKRQSLIQYKECNPSCVQGEQNSKELDLYPIVKTLQSSATVSNNGWKTYAAVYNGVKCYKCNKTRVKRRGDFCRKCENDSSRTNERVGR